MICHHKEPLTPANINDPEVTLNWSLAAGIVPGVPPQGALHHFTDAGRFWPLMKKGTLWRYPPC